MIKNGKNKTAIAVIRDAINSQKIGETIKRRDLISSGTHLADASIDVTRRLFTLAEYISDTGTLGVYLINSHVPEDLTDGQLRFRAKPDSNPIKMRPEWEDWWKRYKTSQASIKFGL